MLSNVWWVLAYLDYGIAALRKVLRRQVNVLTSTKSLHWPSHSECKSQGRSESLRTHSSTIQSGNIRRKTRPNTQSEQNGIASPTQAVSQRSRNLFRRISSFAPIKRTDVPPESIYDVKLVLLQHQWTERCQRFILHLGQLRQLCLISSREKCRPTFWEKGSKAFADATKQRWLWDQSREDNHRGSYPQPSA